MLNFDYLAIIIVIIAVLNGAFRGFYKQLNTTISLAGAFAVVFFTKPILMPILEAMPIYTVIAEAVQGILKFVTNLTVAETGEYLMFLILFIASFVVIHVLFNAFSPSSRSHIMKEKSKLSRIFGAIFGFVGGYAIIMLMLIVTKPITPVDYTTPITNILITINEPLQIELGIDSLGE